MCLHRVLKLTVLNRIAVVLCLHGDLKLTVLVKIAVNKRLHGTHGQLNPSKSLEPSLVQIGHSFVEDARSMLLNEYLDEFLEVYMNRPD